MMRRSALRVVIILLAACGATNMARALVTLGSGQSRYFCSGTSLVLSASGAPAGAAYAWLRNGSLVTGSGSTYTAAVSGTYRVIATTGGVSDTSVPVRLTEVPARIYVSSGVAVSGSGAAWGSAVRTVSEALFLANQSGCTREIWVKAGLYYPASDSGTAITSRDSAFRIVRNGIKLYGGFNGTETVLSARSVTANPTILSGDIGVPDDMSDNSWHVITVVGGVTGPIDTTTRIDGFTITRGNGSVNFQTLIFGVHSVTSDGGGIALIGSGAGNNCSPFIANCTLTNNTANVGGAAYCGAYNGGASSPYFSNCVIRDNNASDVGGIHAYADGVTGLAAPRIFNSRFLNNTAANAGAIGCFNDGSPAGGVYVESSVFIGNTVTGNGGVFNGYGANSRLTAVNCVFADNSAGNAGGAMITIGGASSTLINCTFSNNSATANPASGTFDVFTGGTLSLNNTIAWGANATQITNSGTVNYDHSNVRGITAPANSSSRDPLFVNAADPDGSDNLWGTTDDGLRLQACSPLIDKGLSTGVPTSITQDIAGAGRIQQLAPDMGAYESAGLNLSLELSVLNFTNPTTCGGADGIVRIGNLVPGRSFMVNFSRNGVPQAPVTAVPNASGILAVSGLTAGTYSAFSASYGGCTSVPFAGTATLADPAAATLTAVTGADPAFCGGADGSVTLTGTIPGTTARVSYTYNGVPQTPVTLPVSAGTVVIAGLRAGSYTALSVSTAGCASNVLAGPVLLTNPVPAITAINAVDPLFCGGADGALTITGLVIGQTYTVRYDFNGVPQTPVSQSTAASGILTIAGLSAGTYTNISASLSVCTSAVVAGPVVLNPPLPPVISSITTVAPSTCGGSDGRITINGLLPSTQYSIYYFPSGGGSVTLNPVSSDAAGSYTITGLTARAYGSISVIRRNCLTTYPTSVTVPPPPAPAPPTPASNGPVCTGSTLQLQSGPALPGATYSWTGPGGFSSTLQNPVRTGMLASMSGSYQLVISVANCTSASGSVNVGVIQTPENLVAGSNSPVCEGTPVRLSGSSTTPGAVFSWTGPHGFTAATASPVLPGATLAMAGTYTLNATDATATCSTSAATSVVVNPSPVIASVSGSDPLTCNGTSGFIRVSGLAAGNPYTISFLNGTTPQSATGSADAGGVFTIAGLGRGTYSNIVATLGNCSSAPHAGSITLQDPLPPGPPAASSNAPVCQTGTLNLSVTGLAGASFDWTGPNGFSSTLARPAITGMTPAGAGTYSVTQTIAGCVSVPATVSVSLIALPPAPVSISGPAAPCIGSTNTYSVSALAGATSYVWTMPASWTSTGATNGPGISLVTGTGSGTVTVAAVNSCGTGPVQTLSVATNTAPAMPAAISGPATVCDGIATTYSIPRVSNTTRYVWSLPAGWSGSATDTSITAVPGISSGTIHVMPVNACGSGNSQSISVTVRSIPAQPAAITGAASPCIGTAQLYYIPAVAGATSYSWSLPAGGTPPWSGTASGAAINALVGAASGNISVTAGNQCGSSLPRTFAVTVKQLPAAAGPITGAVTTCIGAAGTYSIAPVADAVSYTWNVPLTWSGGGTTSAVSLIAGSTPGTITVTPVGVCGNGAPSSLPVTVIAPVIPAVALARSAPSDTICAGTPVTFTAAGTNAGPAPVYEFRRNGALVLSSGVNTYTTSALGSGDRISVTMRSSLPCITISAVSDSIRMTVLPIRTPGININTEPPTALCAGQTVTLQSNDTNGGTHPSYEWYLNGKRVPGVSSTSYTPSTIHQGDSFQVVMTSNVVCAKYTVAASNKVGFTVLPVVMPTVSIVADPAGPVAPGSMVTFTATHSNGGANPDFQWLKNATLIPGATGPTWSSDQLLTGDEITVRMLSEAPCAEPELVLSNVIRMRVGTTGLVPGSALEAGIRLYPNPNTGRFTVMASGMRLPAGSRSSIDVLNALGQTVYHMAFVPDRESWSHDVWLNEGLANGTYLLRVSAESGGATAIPFFLNR